MAETIEYNNLVKFIQHDVIEERLAWEIRRVKLGMTGGSSGAATEKLYTSIKDKSDFNSFWISIKDKTGAKYDDAALVWNYYILTGTVQTSSQDDSIFIDAAKKWAEVSKGNGLATKDAKLDLVVDVSKIKDEYKDMFDYFDKIVGAQDKKDTTNKPGTALNKSLGSDSVASKEEASAYVVNVHNYCVREYITERLKMTDIKVFETTTGANSYELELHKHFITFVQKYMMDMSIEKVKAIKDLVGASSSLEKGLKEQQKKLRQDKLDADTKTWITKLTSYFKSDSTNAGSLVGSAVSSVATATATADEIHVDHIFFPIKNSMPNVVLYVNNEEYTISATIILLLLSLGFVAYKIYNSPKKLNSVDKMLTLAGGVLALVSGYGVITGFGVVESAYAKITSMSFASSKGGSVPAPGLLQQGLAMLGSLGNYFSAGSSPSTQQIIGAVVLLIGTITGGMGIRALYTYFNSPSAISDLDELLKSVNSKVTSGQSFSNEAALFTFNKSTGLITTILKGTRKFLISLGAHYGVTNIYLLIDDEGNITYTVNDIAISSISLIENKPVATALVLAYLIKDKHFSKVSEYSTTSGEPSDYVFKFQDDGSLVLQKKNGDKFEEVTSISMAIRQQMSGNETGAEETKKQVCTSIFGDQEDEEGKGLCSKHFYSILGRAGLNMLENIGDSITKSKLVNSLESAEVNVKYEILKNLDWKMKISNGNKAMVSVDEWINRLKEDRRDGVKQQGAEYEKYLNGTGAQVKNILQNMVNHINTNSRLLQEKYKEAVEQPVSTSGLRRRKRLTDERVAHLRAQVITENSLLNSPFPYPGRPGSFLYPINQNGGGANFTNNYKQSFNMIKQSLAGYNQKLSSTTEKKLEEKIQKIEKLETELYDIHSKINMYTKLLRSDKNARFHKKEVRIEDIEDLINNYADNTKKQTRYIATVTTAFGKIKMLLQGQDEENGKQRENYYNL